MVRVIGGLCALLLILATSITAPAHDKDKQKESSVKDVDSGALGIFMGGRRVATETFSIRQSNSGSVIQSEFKSEQGADTALQTSQLDLTLAGEIRKYEWKETSPQKMQAEVVPNDQFLLERTTTNSNDKPAEQPFLLPASTSILDDYFFIQREVLLWRYLATGCRQDKGQLKCPLHQHAQFGTLDPHSRSSMPVTVEFSGRETVPIHGAQVELSRFDLKSDAGDWAIWLNDQFKLMRIVIPDENTEVVRD